MYAATAAASHSASFLFLADQFSKYHTDSLNVKTYEPGVVSRATTGFYFTNTFDKLNVTAAAYHQFGKTNAMQKISGYLLSLSAQYALTKAFSAGAGFDYTSGGNNGATSKAFDPLYGTPHKFWGLMDYFYAASPFGKGGLQDFYIKTKYKLSNKTSVTADFHQFNSATGIVFNGETKRNFGQELDFVGTYALTKQISFEGGYSHFFTTPLLTSANVKNVLRAKTNADWAYIMVIIKPDFLLK